jgi:hypothetical protein
LRPAVPLTQRTNLRPDFSLDGLQQEQCGASLVLTILVITSNGDLGDRPLIARNVLCRR